MRFGSHSLIPHLCFYWGNSIVFYGPGITCSEEKYLFRFLDLTFKERRCRRDLFGVLLWAIMSCFLSACHVNRPHRLPKMCAEASSATNIGRGYRVYRLSLNQRHFNDRLANKTGSFWIRSKLIREALLCSDSEFLSRAVCQLS